MVQPFHPLRGRELALVTCRQNWGEQRAYFDDDSGRLTTIPLAWTSLAAVDPLTGRLVERRFFDNLVAYAAGSGTPTEVWAYTQRGWFATTKEAFWTIVNDARKRRSSWPVRLYDAFGREKSVTQTVGSAVRTASRKYDAQGRLIVESTPEGTIAYEYDDLGRRVQTAVFAPGSDPAVDTPERTTSFTYDVLGRLQSVVEDRDASLATDPLLTVVYAYDLAGNLHSEPYLAT